MSTGSWDDFLKYLDTVYGPSFAPEYLAFACPVEGVPDDVWHAAKMIFPDPQAWLDNPIPQLDGKTAREAIAAGKGDAVREIITQVSGFFLPPPDEVRPWVDPDEGSAEG